MADFTARIEPENPLDLLPSPEFPPRRRIIDQISKIFLSEKYFTVLLERIQTNARGFAPPAALRAARRALRARAALERRALL